MDSLLDDVDSLIAPGLSTDTPDWCTNCQSLKQEIKRLQEEQLQNFGKLKQKIISTDLLIKKYKSKCDDYDLQSKRTEEANKRADKFQRQSEILETQLKAALLDTEPLRNTKITLEAEIRLKNAEIQSLSDRLLAVESAQKQYEHMSRDSAIDIEKLEAEKKELLSKIKTIEAGKISKTAAKELKSEILNLKKEKTGLIKNEKRLEHLLSAAQSKIDHLTNTIKERKLSPIRCKRTSSGIASHTVKSPIAHGSSVLKSRLAQGSSPLRSPTAHRLSSLKSPTAHGSSPLKSQTLSPRGYSLGGHKPLPVVGGHSRTMSERESDSQNKDVILPPSNEKLASESSSSSDDSDDSASMCSVSWTFSPIMKCLSPLPPSPACFAERKVKREEDTDIDIDNEDEVSDIADELEQQLLGESTQEQVLLASEETEGNIIEAQENITEDLKEETLIECEEKQTVGITVNSLKSTTEKCVPLETSRTIVERTVIKEKHKNIANELSVEVDEEQLTLKERLAKSIAIISPTAVRKRTAHQVNRKDQQIDSEESRNTTNLHNTPEDTARHSEEKTKKPPIRRSARLCSQRDSETSDQASDTNETKETNDKHVKESGNVKDRTNGFTRTVDESSNSDGILVVTKETTCDKQELCRNNTEEFTPFFSETLSDSDDQSVSKEKANIETSDSHAPDWNLENSQNVSNNSVSSQDVTFVANCIGTNDGENVDKIKTNSIKTSANEMKTDSTEEQVTVTKAKQTDELKTPPTLKPCHQKHEQVNTECRITALTRDNKVLSKDKEAQKSKEIGDTSETRYEKSKVFPNKFINFQKSSAGTLANELEDFSYVNDYEVLDRSDKDSKICLPKENGKPSKNVKRRLRKSYKYKDFDSVTDIENNDDKFGVSNELVDRETSIKIPVKEKSVPESGVRNELKYSNTPFEKLNNTVSATNREQSEDVSEDATLNDKSEKSKLLPDEMSERLGCEQQENEVCSRTACVNADEKGDAMLTHDFVKDSPKESRSEGDFNSNVGTLIETEGLANSIEKVTPNRQLSTGFTVNLSTDHPGSCGNSPLRHFNFEPGVCDTIAEEETSEEAVKGDKGDEKSTKNDYKTELIFGVEDLLDIRNVESPPVCQQSVNAQNITKPFCDISTNSDKTFDTQKTDNVLSNTSSERYTLPSITLNDQENKPGCSYHFHESNVSLSLQRVSMVTDAAKDASQEEKLPFESDTLHNEDSSSRSSIQSITSLDRASPLSPLSISPFDFLNPISPLPPSPIRDIERVSPLSPELVSEEQTFEADVKNPDIVEDNEKDKDESVIEKEVDTEKSGVIGKQSASFDSASIDKVELNLVGNEEQKLVNLVGNEEQKLERIIAVKEAGFNLSDKTETTQMKEIVQTVHKEQDNPNKETDFNEESLKLFNLPQMISPVKTPKSNSKIKSKQIRNSSSIRDLTENIKEKCEKSGLEKAQPKLFSTQAPEGAIAVKPRTIGSKLSLEKTNLDICVRKSGRTAVKRVSLGDKTGASETKKVSVASKDCPKISSVNKTHEHEIELDKSDAKHVKDMDKKAEVLHDTTGSMEKSTTKIEDSVDDRKEGSTVEKIDEKGDNKVIEVCPNGQDNLAFKRKARVAHKPNIQPQKTHRIQIIDPPVLPPVTAGRKRKSLEFHRDEKDKKEMKEGTVKKQKPSSAEKAVKPDSRKKMQAYLKSAESAESFIAKFSQQTGEDGFHLALLDVCLECLGRVQTDTLDVVYKTCVNGQYQNIDFQFPFLSDVDKKAVELIQYMVTDLKADRAVIMKKIWDSVFNCNLSAKVVGKMAICRVYVALCALQGDLEQARIFFYHLVTCGHLDYTTFIVSVVSVWPEVLKKDPTDRPDTVSSHGMTLVLEEVVTKTLLSQGSEASNKILVVLQKLCGWSGSTGNADSVIKLLCGRLMAVLDIENTDKSAVLELTKALELLYRHQTWAWFKEHFIMRHGLQTASNKYLAVKITKPVPPEYVCEILRITSRGISLFSSHVREREYQQIIRNWLLPLLSHKPENTAVRQCCLETLVELTPLYPACLETIHRWFSENKGNVSQEFVARLEYLRQQYKQKFGLQCKPFC